MHDIVNLYCLTAKDRAKKIEKIKEAFLIASARIRSDTILTEQEKIMRYR